MRVEFYSEKAWKEAIAELTKTSVDFSTGTIEDMFIIIHNPDNLHLAYGWSYV